MVEITPLAPAHESDWRRLWRIYLDYYETERPETVYAATFRRLLDPVEPMFGRVALLDGAPVGLVHAIYHRHCWHESDVCYLQDLVTDPAHRGGGVARALIESVYAEADKADAASVYWMTQEFNYRGRMLYDQLAIHTPFIKYQRP